MVGVVEDRELGALRRRALGAGPRGLQEAQGGEIVLCGRGLAERPITTQRLSDETCEDSMRFLRSF